MQHPRRSSSAKHRDPVCAVLLLQGAQRPPPWPLAPKTRHSAAQVPMGRPWPSLPEISGSLSVLFNVGGPVDAAVEEIASRTGHSPAQVLLRWNLQQDRVVVTTTSKKERMQELAGVQSFDLSAGDKQIISQAGDKLFFRWVLQ